MPGKPTTCPGCNRPAAIDHSSTDADVYLVRCLRCGQFEVTGSACAVLGGQQERGELDHRRIANLSGWLREHQGFRITEHNVDQLLSIPTPAVGQRAEKLLLHLAKSHPDPGELFELDMTKPELLSMAWARNDDEVRYLVESYLGQATPYLEILARAMPAIVRVAIAPGGWAHIESLRLVTAGSDVGFIAMWFHERTKDLRERGLKPALLTAGYRPLPIDEKLHNNPIDAEIIATIRQSRLLVADLHGDRGGVYYEAGFAMALNIPVFWTCHEKDLDEKQIHFDVRQYAFESWDGGNWDGFARRLQHRIEAVIGKGSYRPPSS